MSHAWEARRESWDQVQASLGRSQKEVLCVIKAHPEGIGPWKCSQELKAHPYIVRPRFTELAEKGLISEVGKNYDTPTGKPEAIYRAVYSSSNGLLELWENY